MNFQNRGALQGTMLPDLISCRAANDFPALARAVLANETPVSVTIAGLNRANVIGAKNGLIRFLKETPKEEQRNWALHLPRDPDFDEPDDGVIQKDENDEKWFCHYRPDLRARLHERGIVLTDPQRRWFTHMDRIRTACVAHLLALAEEMDRQQPGHAFLERAEAYVDQNVVRVLRYVPRQGTIAKPHTDRCAITFHLAESHSGLCTRQGFEKIPTATPMSPEALCFTGQQLERITRGAVPARWHEVENLSPKEPRWALVFFGKMCPK